MINNTVVKLVHLWQYINNFKHNKKGRLFIDSKNLPHYTGRLTWHNKKKHLPF